MKTFVKIVLGNLLALILFGFVVVAFFSAALTALFLTAEPVETPSDSVLVFDLSANITDAPASADIWKLVEESVGPAAPPTYSLRAMTASIRAAATDPKISSLFIHGNLIPQGYGAGFATLRELRFALEEFQASGKPLVAYLENPTVRDYYVASVADQIMMNPYGLMGLNGLASQQIFIEGALEKYGVGIQIARVGRFKSAVEMFTETQMSEASRAQVTALLADLWAEALAGISKSRGISVADLQQIADTDGFIEPREALEADLIDRIGYLDEALAQFHETTGTEPDDIVPQVGLNAYSTTRHNGPADHDGAAIAVVYVEGNIVAGEGGSDSAGGARYAREIRRLRQDEQVKALVLRVNSPGGSVSAAENIQREVALARERMPVIVSFGTVAASGGYWISTDSDRIFAQPNTITGSIGVFGILPNIQGLANHHGVTFDAVKTAKFADIYSLTRPKTPEEMQRIQEMVEGIYQDFLEKVAEGRNMPVEEVHEIAQGRVWSGEDALQIGLVDEIGGLGAAIAYAAEQAELEEWHLHEFPRPKDVADVLEEMLAPGNNPLVARGPIQKLSGNFQSSLEALQTLNDPRGVYARLPFSLSIQ